MFLMNLDDDKKDLFLDLAIYVAKSDNDFADVEKNIINQYLLEMNYTKNLRYKPLQSLNDVLTKISNICTHNEKKAFLFEILALVLADGKYVNEEKEIITKIITEFNISENDVNKCIDLLKKLSCIYQDIDYFIKN